MRETLIAFPVDKSFGVACQALATTEMATVLPSKKWPFNLRNDCRDHTATLCREESGQF
jgi:hypothetical protein